MTPLVESGLSSRRCHRYYVVQIMKLTCIAPIAVGWLGILGAAEPRFDLKPGFYSGDEPGWARLNELENKASVHIDLSWHAGISIGKESDMTLDELRSAVRKIKGRALASVRLDKNYSDKSLHLNVEKLLLDEGFNAVLITGAHSGGAYLERYTTKSEAGAGQAATGPESKSDGSQKRQPESKPAPR
jgi:hypothetical protein